MNSEIKCVSISVFQEVVYHQCWPIEFGFITLRNDAGTHPIPITNGLFPTWFISCLIKSNPFIWRQVLWVEARAAMRFARASGPRVAHSVFLQSKYFLWLSNTSLARAWENSPMSSNAMVLRTMCDNDNNEDAATVRGRSHLPRLPTV